MLGDAGYAALDCCSRGGSLPSTSVVCIADHLPGMELQLLAL